VFQTGAVRPHAMPWNAAPAGAHSRACRTREGEGGSVLSAPAVGGGGTSTDPLPARSIPTSSSRGTLVGTPGLMHSRNRPTRELAASME